jgi:hypothetical protein
VLTIDKFYVPFAFWDGAVTSLEMHVAADQTNQSSLRTAPRRLATPLTPLALKFEDRNATVQRFSLTRPKRNAGAFQAVPVSRERPAVSTDPGRNRDLPLKSTCVIREVGSCTRWQAIVYRPYIVAQVQVAGGEVPVLIDAHSGRIVSCPALPEAKALLAALTTVGPKQKATRARVLAPRCPRCGNTARLEPRDVIALCRHCGSGLAPGDEKVEAVPVQIAASPDKAIYVPFWRYRIALEIGGETLADLETWSAMFRLAKLFSPKGEHLLVPAMPWPGFVAGDIAFAQACRSVHFDPPAFDGAAPHPSEASTFLPFRLDEPAARSLARTALLSLFEPGPATRLTPARMDRLLLKADLQLREPAACYVAFSPNGEGAQRGRFKLSAVSLAPQDERGRPTLTGFKPQFLNRPLCEIVGRPPVWKPGSE